MQESDREQLSPQELSRYSRHLIIPEFNIAGQLKLKKARVAVIGAGGLGSPVLLYLAAAGVGTLGIIDFDRVDESNLQRQVLYDRSCLGALKVEAARTRLEKLNPHLRILTYAVRLSSENALDILKSYDIVIDGTDNFPTRYLVNDACLILEKPLVYGSIFQFEGQVSVFNQLKDDGTRSPNYRDLFPTPPPPGMVPSCAEGGVLGVLPGIIGSLQANETLKLITGIGETLQGKLYIFDALGFQGVTLNLKHNPDVAPVTELIDYEMFCGISDTRDENPNVAEISPSEFQEMRDQGVDFQLIDVRQPYEFEIVHLGGELIPLEKLAEHTQAISRDKKVVVYCRSGKRSADAIIMLQDDFGFDNLVNLQGGLLAYAREIDPSMVTY